MNHDPAQADLTSKCLASTALDAGRAALEPDSDTGGSASVLLPDTANCFAG